MKKFINNRVLPIVCALSILISLCIPFASAASGYGSYEDTESRDMESVYAWDAHLRATDARPIDVLASYFGVDTEEPVVFFRLVDGVVGDKYGEITREELDRLAVQLNSWFGKVAISDLYNFIDVSATYAKWTLATCFGLPNVDFQVVEGSPAGYYRIQDTVSGLYVVNMGGMYPCTPIDGITSGEERSYQWIGEVTAADRAKTGVEPTTLDELNLICTRLRDSGIPAQIRTLGTNYKCIWHNRQVYADADGNPLVAWANENQSATNQERLDTTVNIDGENVDVIEGNQTNIDLGNMLVTLPDGSINFIDKIIYDESTKTYHVESHDTYNYTTNNYYTWNYHINYTSVTYIGQTEEYNKYYEVYYELPDGRSSADLTKEDLEQLNLAIDVIPYARAADDVAVKALYHFDGDTRDASFWNYVGKFQWNKGASITYMDASVFDGALYLDETEHDFSFILPRFLVDDTFVMQWRYYQSATAAPVTDSYVAFGTNKLIQFNGESLLDGSGNVLAEMPIGSWNEIAIMRKDAAAYVYLNGLVVGQFTLGSIITNKLDFHFGNEQQTFKYFDEFRVVTDEVYPIGSSYTPTAVPFDTNLTLVVPDGDYVVADEWKEFVKSDKAVLSFDFTQGEFAAFDSTPSFYAGYPQLTYGQVFTMITDGSFGIDYEWTENGLVLTREEGSSGFVTSGMAGLCMSLSSTYNTTDTFRSGSYPNLVIYTGSGSYSWTYCGFTYSGHDDENYSYVPGNAPALNMGCYPNNKTGSKGGNLVIYPFEDSLTISRIELYVQEASPSDFSRYITHSAVSVMNPEQLRNPTLAVRTDLDITGYQIGGVRPSVPTKGQVWALVENQRITSIQIYNGQAWESCDGRIWTGERWIPSSSYNIVTLQDMYDIVDATPDYEYIYTESGFWSWWQKSWNAFTERLFAVFGSGATGSGGATLTPDTAPAVPDDESTGEKGYSIIDLFVVLKDGTWSFITGIVSTAYDGFNGFVESVSSAGSFFDFYDDDSEDSIFFIPLEEGETIWD